MHADRLRRRDGSGAVTGLSDQSPVISGLPWIAKHGVFL